MEPKFKTSFIPKQALTDQTEKTSAPVSRPRKSRSMASVFSFIVLVGAIALSVAVFAYNQYLEQSIAQKSEMLQRAREAFQPALIRELERLDQRIESAEQLLADHTAPSGLFTLLEATTLKSVRFNNLSFRVEGQNVAITLEGAALNFDAVALQSDVFGSNRFIKDPIVSGLDVSTDNLITFNVDATVDSRFLSYTNLLNGFEDDGQSDSTANGATNGTTQ